MGNSSQAFTPASLRKNRNSGSRIKPPAETEEVVAKDDTAETVKDTHFEPEPAETVKAESPKIETPKVSAAPVAPVVKVTAIDPTTAVINECLSTYKKLLSNARVTNAQAAQAMAYLKKATDVLISHPTTANLSAVWTFQQQNRNGVCNEKLALTGINVLDPKSRRIVTVVYNAFRARVMGYLPLRDNEILSVVPCQRLVQFLKTALR